MLCAVSTHADAKSDALIEAAKTNNAAEARRLIASGADVNAKVNDGWTALMSAALNKADDLAKLMIESGADVNAKDDKGKTALTYALERDASDVADILLNAVGAR